MVRILLPLFVLVLTFGCESPKPPASTPPKETTIEETSSTASAEEASPPSPTVEPDKPPSEEPVATKTPRKPIYIEAANGQELIDEAVKAAQSEGKKVLIEWGGNWGIWCYRLHDIFHENPEVHPIIQQDYILVLIDCTSNQDLLKKYGGENEQFAFPHLTILDSQGKVLTNQETSSLEEGDHHDPKKIADFLNEWKPASVNALDPKPVHSVESVTGSLQNETAVLLVTGIVNSGGWTNATLKPVNYIIAPPDGIYDYRFLAQAPEGMATMALSPIETSPITIDHADGKKGVRINAEQNSLTLRFLQKTKDLPKPISPVSIKSAKIVDGMLQIEVSFTGSKPSRHGFELLWNGSSTRSMPPQMNFLLIHKANNDSGKAILEQSLTFALPANLAPATIRLLTSEEAEPVEVKFEAASH